MEPLTLAEKAALVAGGGFWETAAAPGLSPIVLADGPHGVRRPVDGGDSLGLGEAIPSTCYPPAVALASSSNAELVERVGRALGIEARSQGVDVLLGPGVNIKRSPLCGRNFEYFSEDPLVSGELGAAWVRGLQSTGVGASVKHFAANNQETNRMTISAEVDERTLREIYFPAFETIVTREQPFTVMCSYNRINGVFSAENEWLLDHVLRGEWGFDGLVVSDWGAVDDRVAALSAGTDLEMPGPQAQSKRDILEAVSSGAIDEAVLDRSVQRIRDLGARAKRARAIAVDDFDATAAHDLAREAASESIVLLRNEGSVLPLTKGQSVALIGEFARTPRFQGAGSSQVQPTLESTALDAMSSRSGVHFAPGYSFGAATESRESLALRDEAVTLASRTDVAIVFVGLPEGDESEGFDRTHLNLPETQERLIRDVAAVNSRTVVVLTNGGVVSLEPWHDSVAAIVEAWLLGQAGGAALADVLCGTANPSGRLAETIPLRLEDNPTFFNFPGERDRVRYGEGVFVGYRFYESADIPVRYPFGHGLSYTTFEWSDFSVTRDGRVATVTVTNTGDRPGADVVQLYVSADAAPVRSPRRELRAFRKVELKPGESQTLTMGLTPRAYSFWDVATDSWQLAGGSFELHLGRSARDIVLRASVDLPRPREAADLGLDSPVSDFLEHPVTGPLFRRFAGAGASEGGASVLDMVGSMPMRRLLRFPGVGVSESTVRHLLSVANNRVVSSIARFFSRG